MKNPFCDDNLLQHILWMCLESQSAVSLGQFWESIVLSIKKYTFGREQKRKKIPPYCCYVVLQSRMKKIKTIAWLLTINMSVDVANISSFLFIICCLLSIEILFGFYEVWLNLFNLLLMEQKAWALQKTWLH